MAVTTLPSSSSATATERGAQLAAIPQPLPTAEPRLSATGKRWLRRGDVASFSRPGLPPLIADLLTSRGVTAAEQAELFLSGALEEPHDPALLPQIDAALERIARAIRSSEQIAVYGDYDVDGITATAILVQGITSLGGNVIPYLPNRFVEGYGVNSAALATLRRQGATLVITADCGISSHPEVAFGNEIGLDTIIVDHHSIPPQLPDAVAIVDPKLPGCLYPSTELAACGLAYKLVPALAALMGQEYDHRTGLDLAALGTVCDMAPLLGENRWIVRQGLKALARSRRPGLLALADASGVNLARATAESCGFRLGPRLNAAGRLYDAGIAYKLVTTDDPLQAAALAEQLNQINTERQQLTVRSFAIACALVEAASPAPLLLVGDPAIPQGIVGLVAGRLAEQYGKPAFVYERGTDQSRGSARGVPGFDVVEALQAAASLLVRFGGHRQAGGFTVETAALPALHEFLQEHAARRLGATHAAPVLEYDADVALEALTATVTRWLPYLEPFGQANPEPVFRAGNLEVLETRVVGADRRHLVVRLGAGAASWRGIAFGLAHAQPVRGSRADVLFSYRTDERGRPDLHIKDIAPALV